jgi:hypothetical protein
MLVTPTTLQDAVTRMSTTYTLRDSASQNKRDRKRVMLRHHVLYFNRNDFIHLILVKELTISQQV